MNGLTKILKNFVSEGDILFLLQQVCIDVTELHCDIHLYSDCRLTMTNKTFASDDQVIKTFQSYKCTDGKETVTVRKKYEPNCKIEETKNCVQVWKTLANGEKVLQQIINRITQIF